MYRQTVTNYYYSSSSYNSRTLYRHSYFPNNSGNTAVKDDEIITVLSTAGSGSGPTNYSTAGGPGSSTWAGLSTAADTTAEYATIDAAAHSTATTLYTIYKFAVQYNKGSNVSAIGSENGEC